MNNAPYSRQAEMTKPPFYLLPFLCWSFVGEKSLECRCQAVQETIQASHKNSGMIFLSPFITGSRALTIVVLC